MSHLVTYSKTLVQVLIHRVGMGVHLIFCQISLFWPLPSLGVQRPSRSLSFLSVQCILRCNSEFGQIHLEVGGNPSSSRLHAVRLTGHYVFLLGLKCPCLSMQRPFKYLSGPIVGVLTCRSPVAFYRDTPTRSSCLWGVFMMFSQSLAAAAAVSSVSDEPLDASRPWRGSFSCAIS